MGGHVWLFKKTHLGKGRRRVIQPSNSPLKYLSYGRITLEKGEKLAVDSKTEEIALICYNGQGRIMAGGKAYEMTKWDSLYLPINSKCEIAGDSFFDLVECAAPSTHNYEIQFVQWRNMRSDKSLIKELGPEPMARTIYTLIGEENVQASRLLIGITFSKEGNWTSWPPHEHSNTREEIYLFIDMPPPSFGIQFVYTDFENMEFVEPVKEGDAVVIQRGYHPNVGAPGGSINFMWILCGLEEVKDRKWADVNVQPEFK